MPVEVANVAPEVTSLPNGDLKSQNPSGAAKKSRESERRRRRRKQKKNKHSGDGGDDIDAAAEDANGTAEDSSKENSNPQKALEPVEVEYVPEDAELDGVLDDEFRKVFEKFKFLEPSATEENDKKDATAVDAPTKKKNSDSDDEEQETQQKEKGGISNKQKKIQRRMKIAELKQICSRPDVVEVKFYFIR
ncbi:proline-rich spliceosome-associated (PSP) family protein [Striga hermonthica]|uniref:Proline-rich spliceosome-associated (PSP) family protein n=1 Tax=Striga hermonthica TaxID=68872 RepID=A0A9N7MWD1_STRHE|nr:proline-rich spliceosome-associated (PSP) family protein [Striga hermonthica]